LRSAKAATRLAPARSQRLFSKEAVSYQLSARCFMGWFLETIWCLISAVLDLLGARHHLIKEEISARPKDNVI